MTDDRWAAKYAVWREAYPDQPDRVARAVVSEIISELVEDVGITEIRRLLYQV